MTGSTLKNFNLQWHQHGQYRIHVYPKAADFSAPVLACLKNAGMQAQEDGGMAITTATDWKTAWDAIHSGLKTLDALAGVEVAVVAADAPHSRAELDCKAPVVIQLIAESLWLGDALIEDRVMCYLQPVHSSKDKIFGYESFARVKALDGKIIAGDQIIAASKVLGIEYMIDRHLHVEAIKTFVMSEFNGFLFVNFFPGFIHRPAVYLEGLSETAKEYGVIAKNIVLDFTKSETPRDSRHLKNVCEYGRSRGYSIAIDDVVSIDSARKLITDIRPDFVKIDMHLVRQAQEVAARETIRTIVEMAHANAGTVIAEGVESEDIFQALRLLNVDLFQGYLFSPPVPVEAVLKRSTGTAGT